MPFLLPGLGALPIGIDSAIGNRQARSNANVQEFLDNLAARRAGILDNDDLEFRRQFAEQPGGTPLLQRFDNIIGQSTNPFVSSQALISSAASAPALAQRGLQNQAFALQQGLPVTPQGVVNQGFAGLQPILDQQANAQRQQIFASAPTLAGSTVPAQTAQTISAQNSARNNQASADVVANLSAQVQRLTQALAQSRLQGANPIQQNRSAQDTAPRVDPLATSR